MNRLLKTTFDNRGYTPGYLKEINNPDKNKLKDLDVLCHALKDAHDKQKHIVMLGDFDMDGIMSSVTGFAGLAELGFRVSLFIPNPQDGYGFTAKTIGRLLIDYPDTDVILTCDVGISCHDGIAAAQMAGIQVLVTDHHKQSAECKADVVVNPMRMDETYSHPYICGAYVLYQCLEHYAELYCDVFTREQIARLRVFAGIGTVSDSMPLLYENRELVRDAISILKLIYADGDDFIVNNIMGHDVYRRAFQGLYKVLQGFADIGKIVDRKSISEEFMGYYLAPTFNSIKRMDGEMIKAFDVFFGTDPDEAIGYLISLNEQRKVAVAEYYEKLKDDTQPYAPFLYFSEARPGILGLLAQKVMLETGSPTLVINKDTMNGSGRSPEWYPFLDKVVSEGFWAAGHNPAFGVGFTDKRELESMIAFLEKDVKEVYDSLDRSLLVSGPDFVITSDGTGDTGIDILLFAEYLHELKKYRPFGKGFEAPDILLKFKASDGIWSVMGRVKQHLKIQLAYGFTVLLWNQSPLLDLKDSNKDISVSGKLEMSEFNGRHTINFIGNILEAI